ncbi:MAG: M20 family metallo-hydrolase [Defluviicoccus sp.]|nr:M20 family metallo-hydrolase [Defluviicoccus sp.]
MTVSGAAAAVDEARLWQRHMTLAEIGATAKGGVDRQALSEEEARARALLAEWAGELGYRVSVDGISNLFIRREGADPALAPVLTGSHIDSQPTGGKFDGAFGVLAGLEALQALDEAGIETARPVEVVAWLNEEGSRFAPGMMGSEAFARLRPLDEILAVADRGGTSVADELPRALAATPHAERRDIGFPVAAFVEAHIEQGPALERAGKPIGVVTGIQGVRRMRVRVTGEESHAGTTPKSARRDALWEAARMIDALQRNMHRDEEHRFTVGMMEIRPNVPSVVASEVLFSIDIRHPDSDTLARLEAGVPAICRGASLDCEFETWTIAEASSIWFDDGVVDTIEAAANDLGLGNMRLFSGAGHDARQLSRVCPTGMIFVPCEKGISHNEAENATPSDLADGARVLAETLVRLAMG